MGNLSFIGMQAEEIRKLLSNKYWKDDDSIEFQDRVQLQMSLVSGREE